MSDKLNTRVIQVTNVAPSCSNEQLRTLFSFLGRVKELKVYPPEHTEGAVARVGYVEFEDSVTTGVALHLSSTVFIDRALMIVPVMDGKIPDESHALQLTPQAVAGMLPGQPTWPANVVSQVTGTGPNQVITTYDPRLNSLGLPQYPPLPATSDASKIEEIRRTVYVSDLDPKVTGELLLRFFAQVGEIKYIRLAGDEHAGARAAYIEFTDQRCVAQALSYNNMMFMGRQMSVQHAKTNIIKPPKSTEASQREIDEAMKKVKEASKLISAAAGDAKKESSASPTRKRSRSKSKARSRSQSRPRRSRSRSKGRRRRSRSRSRKRSRSRHRSPRRSRSPPPRRRRSRSRPRRSRSRDRRRSRTRSPIRRRRSRTQSKSRKKSRTPPRSYSKRSRSRSKRRSRSRSRRRSRSRDRKEKAKEKKKSVSMSPPRLERDGSIPPTKDDDNKEKSPPKTESRNNTEPTTMEKNASTINEKDSGKASTKKSTIAEDDSGKASAKKRSPSPVKPRRRSPSPRKHSRSRSPARRKRRRRTRSPSPRKRSRSRSGSRHRSRRDRGRRSRSRDRKHDSKKKSGRDKDEKKKDASSSKVIRDYDEEEKGFGSGSEKDREESEPRSRRSSPSPPPLEATAPPVVKDADHQTVDMDMSD